MTLIFGLPMLSKCLNILAGDFALFCEIPDVLPNTRGFCTGSLFKWEEKRPYFVSFCRIFPLIYPRLDRKKMAANAITTEAIALTEKKMDMSLDDIIKLSKKKTNRKITQRASNKSRGFLKDHASQVNLKVQRFMESRSSIRQGVLAQRRSNFQGSQFPLTTELARNAVAAPIRNRAFNKNMPRVAVERKARGFSTVQRNAREGGFARKDKVEVVVKKRPQTMDALFADMKEQRWRMMSQKKQMAPHNHLVFQAVAQRRRPQQQQSNRRGGNGSGRRFVQ